MNALSDRDRRERPTIFAVLSRISVFVAGLAALLMMGHITLDVFYKYVFNSPVRGTLEIVSHYYMVMVVFLAIPYVDWLRESISVDLFFNMFPNWLRVASVALTLMAMTFAYSGLCYLSIKDALSFMARNEVAMGTDRVLVWPARYVLTFGLGLAAVISFTQLVFFVTGRDRASWLRGEQVIHEA